MFFKEIPDACFQCGREIPDNIQADHFKNRFRFRCDCGAIIDFPDTDFYATRAEEDDA